MTGAVTLTAVCAFLLLIGLYSSLRVSAQADSIMTAYQRRALMRDRPKHLRR